MTEKMQNFVRAIASLQLWDFDQDNGEPYTECDEPIEGYLDSHVALMQAIEEARGLLGETLQAGTEVEDEVDEGQLQTLTGEPIIGTLDTVLCCALVTSAKREADGSLTLNYVGETDVWWDEQRQVVENGEPLFVTEQHDAVPLSQVKLVKV